MLVTMGKTGEYELTTDTTCLNTTNADEEEDRTKKVEKLTYGLTDRPPWHLTLFFALQLVLTNLSSCIITSTVISNTICADALFTSKMFATACVLAGVTTVLQVLIGVRLPIFQGPTILGLFPYLDAKDDPAWRCGQNMTELAMSSNTTVISPDENAWDEEWSKIQGSMLVAAIFETLLGLTGVIGLIAKVIRPVTVTTIFLLLGIYVWEIAANIGKVHWGMSFGSLGMVMLFAIYLNWVRIPVPRWSRAEGWGWTRFPIFELFPLLLTIVLLWPVSHVITVLGGFTDNSSDISYRARTDIYADNIRDSPPFRFPYPGQFGEMRFDLKYTLFYLACLLASATESLADYYQYALACQAPSPPSHAMNRGIVVEGVWAMVAAWLGAGHPTSSYGTIMGIITLTKVGSRDVMLVAGAMITIVGVIGPLGAALVAIPTPVMFGPWVLTISFLVGSGFYNLLTVDVSKRRNLSILGISVYVSCVVCFYLKYTPNAINTRSQLFNDVATGIVKIPFITGGVIAVFLDMTLRDEDKKTTAKKAKIPESSLRMYDPPLIGAWLRRHRVFSYIPFLPGPERRKKANKCCRKKGSDCVDTNDDYKLRERGTLENGAEFGDNKQYDDDYAHEHVTKVRMDNV